MVFARLYMFLFLTLYTDLFTDIYFRDFVLYRESREGL
jgi:hypothetical protein